MADETKEVDAEQFDLARALELSRNKSRKMHGLKRRRGGVRYRRRKAAAKRRLTTCYQSFINKARRTYLKNEAVFEAILHPVVVYICADWNDGSGSSGRTLMAISSDEKNGWIVCGAVNVVHDDKEDYQKRVPMFINELRKQKELRYARFVVAPGTL